MIVNNLPKISIVTPSFNQAQFLEDTIISVLSQNYPNLEYIIIDGGSTDGSVDIIKKYSSKLTYWISEPDKGRGDAINKGFKHSTGEIMAWIGCGDKYCPWAFKVVSGIFNALPQVEWLTSGRPLGWSKTGNPYYYPDRKGYSCKAFFDGLYLPWRGSIQQESTFWLRSLWKVAGSYVDEDFWIMPDFELWFRFWQYAQLYTVDVPLAGIREHAGQKKAFSKGTQVARQLLKKYHKNDFALLYHEIRCLILQVPFLKRLIRSTILTINYDFESDRWIAND